MALVFLSPLHKASRQLSVHIERRNQACGLSNPDSHLLTYLRRFAPVPVGDLIRVFGFKQSTFTSMLDRLERPGYIRREMNAKDRRSFLIHITKAGSDLADGITRQLVEIEKEISARLSASEVKGFQAVMAAIEAVTQVQLRPAQATPAKAKRRRSPPA
jgi:DNA-binding MarR family transcriptional regulator